MFFSFALKAGIRNIPGRKHKANGYSIESPKLIPVSFNKITCVFLYTAQKHEIKYQKNNCNIKLIIKNKINFLLKHFSICLAFFLPLLRSKYASFFNSKILFSDKDKVLNKALAKEEITEE